MTGEHAELAAELRALAETVLDRLEPILLEIAADRTGERGAGTDGADTGLQPACSTCSWCPLCALAALIRGEQHDLVTRLAGQGSVVLAILRQILDDHDRAATDAAAGSAAAGTAPPAESSPPAPTSSFVPIDVTIKD
ncbi:Integral membrane protein [Prescottella defluvii]|uniref:hypothetical protein n=1 Tax=Prescottella defluvii TaxID=1323361 RepID=UPI0004F36CEA|nr:hypothetical protein [Prescottella defluvii]